MLHWFYWWVQHDDAFSPQPLLSMLLSVFILNSLLFRFKVMSGCVVKYNKKHENMDSYVGTHVLIHIATVHQHAWQGAPLFDMHSLLLNYVTTAMVNIHVECKQAFFCVTIKNLSCDASLILTLLANTSDVKKTWSLCSLLWRMIK